MKGGSTDDYESRVSEWDSTSGGKPIPNGWPLIRLGEVSIHCLGKMLDKEKQVEGDYYPYLRNINVQWFRFDLQNLERMRFQHHELNKFSIRNGEVIACEGGEPGRAAIWEHGETNIKFQKALHRIRTSDRLFNRFLVHQLYSDAKSARLNWYFTGTTIKHFTGQDLDRFLFPLPPLDQQHRIVEILEKAEMIKRKHQEGVSQAEVLYGSLAQRAFRGEL